MPSIRTNEKGAERKAGFEFEFTGWETRKTAELIVGLFGGKIVEKTRFDLKVEETDLGEFSVCLDARLVTEEKYLDLLKTLGVELGDEKKREWWEDLVEDVASLAVPYEIGCPPIRLGELHRLESLRETLFKHQAIGTKGRVHYAFGMHLNPELPDLLAGTVLKVLKSFLIHYPWLLKELDVDLARRVAPFINPFPDAYVELVLNPKYWPDQEKFVDDYLEHNSTRNRPLDLLPIFCLWDEEKIRKAMPGEKVKARPTFHYRMPNCLLDDPCWRLARDWNYWVSVEELAWNDARRDELGEKLRDEIAASPLRWQTVWEEKFQELRK